MRQIIYLLAGMMAAGGALRPLPLSNVTLTGDWAIREAANREVLVSLNMTQWACHFTTAANLTSCRPSAQPLHCPDSSSTRVCLQCECGLPLPDQ